MEENGKLVQFIFRGTEVVAEESQESRIRYIRTGELLASDAECARTYYHYASDEMGSITHVTAGAAKEEGGEEEEPPGVKILNQYEYDAWGNVTACEETVENRFRFNGQQYDLVAQQYYLRARFYNPVIGRFTQEDTYRGDGLNLYTYCRNNPVYYADPSGNICSTAAETIRKKILCNEASISERKKYEAYIRNCADKGIELSAEQISAYQQSLSSRNANKSGTALLPYDARTAMRQMDPVEIHFDPGNLHGDDYIAFVSHLKEQENELNRLSLYHTSDLEFNLFMYHNDSLDNVHNANNNARAKARKYLDGIGDVSHALDACAGGYLNNIPYRRPSQSQQQIGRQWGTHINNWTQIIPGRRHVLIPKPET